MATSAFGNKPTADHLRMRANSAVPAPHMQPDTPRALHRPPAVRREDWWLSLPVMARFFVWLTFVLSGFVFQEPPPFDGLMLGLMVLLPLAGLTRFGASHIVLLGFWLLITAAGLVSAMLSPDVALSTKHMAITFYLGLVSVMLAGFVRADIARHTDLILRASLIAAVLGAGAALVGYFNLLPGAYDLFTKFGRARGMFKDPNVFAPFLVLPLLYAVHLATTRSFIRALMPALASLIILLALLLSFSRGGWIVGGLALMIYFYFQFVFAPTNLYRLKLIVIVISGIMVAALGLLAALQVPKIASLMAERAALTNSYDKGPQGRFGGQAKARHLIAENPLGIGALVFAPHYHHEEVHNVYFSMFLNAGWAGGGLYLALVLLTLVLGLRHLLRHSQHRPIFLIAWATFTGCALEGYIVDTDHWRLFFVLIGLIWGMMTFDRPTEQPTGSQNY